MLKNISLKTDSMSEWSITFSCVNNGDHIVTEHSVTQKRRDLCEPPEGDSTHDPNLTKEMLDKDLDEIVNDRRDHFKTGITEYL